MKINHTNLTVSDAQGARRYFEKYFGLRSMDGTTDDAKFVGMRDDDGFVLTLMETKKEDLSYPPTFHIGFLGQGMERTTAIYQQLINDGYDVKPPGHYRGEELYIPTPFGFTVQVS